MKIAFLPVIFFLFGSIDAAVVRHTTELRLGETVVKVHVHENPGSNITFIAPHHNERTGLRIAKEFIASHGGRLVEIESFDARGNPARYIKFVQNGKTFSLDPNRIFTENGRNCGTSVEISEAVRGFAGQLLAMILAPDGRTLRSGERFLVAVHNNTDVSGKAAHAKAGDLTASAFVKLSGSSHGSFHDQADGAYLSNLEDDPDNFIFVSTISNVGFFAEKGFNVVVQKPAAELHSTRCSVDDGSLSVFSAQNAIPYICLEADAVNGAFRQRKMFESIYTLLKNQL